MTIESDRPDEVHRRVIFRGRVQGVNFRYTTRQLAGRFDVGGYVKNLTDGTVELVVSGAPSEVDALLEAIQSRFSSNITDRSVEDLDRAEFRPADGLTIRH